METLLEEMAAFERAQEERGEAKRMVVRALLSIDRGGSVADARETAQLAAQLARRNKYVDATGMSGRWTGELGG